MSMRKDLLRYAIELESNIYEGLRLLCSGSVSGSLWNRFWTASSRVWDDHLKGQPFLSWKPWTPKKWFLASGA